MTEIVRTRDIDAPAGRVWAVLADFASIAAWAPNVDHSCTMKVQTIGLGAVRRVQTGRLTLLETVTTWEPGRVLAYRITGLPPVGDVSNEWRLAPAGTSTRVRLTTRVEAGRRPPQRLLARVVGARLVKASEQLLDGLAAQVAANVAGHEVAPAAGDPAPAAAPPTARAPAPVPPPEEAEHPT